MKEFITYKGKKLYVFNDGFNCQNRQLKAINELKELIKFRNLDSLNLSRNEIAEINGLENFPHLRDLYLSRNKIERISGLENAINLEKLDLSQNLIKDIEGLDNLTNLTYLNLSKNKINKIEGIDKLKRLARLNLSGNKIEKIENLEGLINLKELELSTNNISKIENLKDLVNLEKLLLHINPSITKIENIDHLKKLKSLGFQYCNIKKIEGLSELKNLESLVIKLKDIPGELTKIEGLEHLTNLKTISINSYDFRKFSGHWEVYPIILRFACIVKSNNLDEIEDWKKLVNIFPENFSRFKLNNSQGKINWYFEQCSEKLLDTLQNILSDPIYRESREGKEDKWREIQAMAQRVFLKKDSKNESTKIIRKYPEKPQDHYFCVYIKDVGFNTNLDGIYDLLYLLTEFNIISYDIPFYEIMTDFGIPLLSYKHNDYMFDFQITLNHSKEIEQFFKAQLRHEGEFRLILTIDSNELHDGDGNPLKTNFIIFEVSFRKEFWPNYDYKETINNNANEAIFRTRACEIFETHYKNLLTDLKNLLNRKIHTGFYRLSY